MADVVKELGLKYAEVGPLAIAGYVAALALLAWALITKINDSEQPGNDAVVWVLGIAMVAVALLGAGPYFDAKKHCDDLHRETMVELVRTQSVGDLNRCNAAGM